MLPQVFTIAGVERKPVVFLFTDSQIVNEGFVEDINSILNAGDVPNLFAADEKDRSDRHTASVRAHTHTQGHAESESKRLAGLYSFFHHTWA